jgi:hypothetical protein
MYFFCQLYLTFPTTRYQVLAEPALQGAVGSLRHETHVSATPPHSRQYIDCDDDSPKATSPESVHASTAMLMTSWGFAPQLAMEAERRTRMWAEGHRRQMKGRPLSRLEEGSVRNVRIIFSLGSLLQAVRWETVSFFLSLFLHGISFFLLFNYATHRTNFTCLNGNIQAMRKLKGEINESKVWRVWARTTINWARHGELVDHPTLR